MPASQVTGRDRTRGDRQSRPAAATHTASRSTPNPSVEPGSDVCTSCAMSVAASSANRCALPSRPFDHSQMAMPDREQLGTVQSQAVVDGEQRRGVVEERAQQERSDDQHPQQRTQADAMCAGVQQCARGERDDLHRDRPVREVDDVDVG